MTVASAPRQSCLTRFLLVATAVVASISPPAIAQDGLLSLPSYLELEYPNLVDTTGIGNDFIRHDSVLYIRETLEFTLPLEAIPAATTTRDPKRRYTWRDVSEEFGEIRRVMRRVDERYGGLELRKEHPDSISGSRARLFVGTLGQYANARALKNLFDEAPGLWFEPGIYHGKEHPVGPPAPRFWKEVAAVLAMAYNDPTFDSLEVPGQPIGIHVPELQEDLLDTIARSLRELGIPAQGMTGEECDSSACLWISEISFTGEHGRWKGYAGDPYRAVRAMIEIQPRNINYYFGALYRRGAWEFQYRPFIFGG